MNVCLDSPPDIALLVNLPAKSIHLGPSSDSWANEFADDVIFHDAHKHLLMHRQVRSWPDDTHFPCQHVEELRQFINAQFSQPSSRRVNPEIIFRCLLGFVAVAQMHG